MRVYFIGISGHVTIGAGRRMTRTPVTIALFFFAVGECHKMENLLQPRILCILCVGWYVFNLYFLGT